MTASRWAPLTGTTPMSRRAAIARMGGITAVSLAGCAGGLLGPSVGGDPRLRARPQEPSITAGAGRHVFEEADASGVVFAPDKAVQAPAAPLVLFLHGALRTVDFFVNGLIAGATDAGVILLAPYSMAGSWDALYTGFGPDIRRLDASLRWVFERWQVDPARIVLSGFSDGGTYSLAVGRANGDLFRRVVAYSPGYIIDVDTRGKPPILVTHGTQDTVLPINAASRKIVPELRADGYEVDYREFEGGHGVPLEVANEVMSMVAMQAGARGR